MSQEATEAAPPGSSAPSLQIGHIQACLQLIEIGFKEGAYKSIELVEQVLLLRRDLLSFIAALPVTAAAPPTDEIPDSPAAE